MGGLGCEGSELYNWRIVSSSSFPTPSLCPSTTSSTTLTAHTHTQRNEEDEGTFCSVETCHKKGHGNKQTSREKLRAVKKTVNDKATWCGQHRSDYTLPRPPHRLARTTVAQKEKRKRSAHT